MVTRGRRNRRRRAIIYARQSTFREESISLETQVEHCRAACARLDYDIVGDPVEDRSLSGRSFRKRSITPIIERISAGQADLVMTWKWNRFGRNLVESLLCLAELRQAGGELEAATEPIDASTPAGRMSVAQMLLIAEFQSDNIGESWRDAKRSMILKLALPPTGGARLGYVYDKAKKLYTPHGIVGPALHEAYVKISQGASFYSVARYLSGKGVVTTRGNRITEPGLRVAMDSGFSAGFIRLAQPEKLLDIDDYDIEPGEELFLPNVTPAGARSWEPIIDDNLWFSYRRMRQLKRAVPPRARNPRRQLAGLLRCASCRRVMIYRPDRGRWNCSTQRGKTATDNNPCAVAVTISDAEAIVELKHWIAERISPGPDEVYEREFRAVRINADVTRLESELSDLTRKKQALVRAIEDELIERVDVRSRMREITSEIDRVIGALAGARVQQRTAIDQPRDRLCAVQAMIDAPEADPAIINQMLRTVLETIYVYPLRDQQRVVFVSTDDDDEIPEVTCDNRVDFSDGRVCLGCRKWKPRDAFYVRRRGNQILSRCKECKALAHAERRDSSTR
jgi:site-specific DNA recombinase